MNYKKNYNIRELTDWDLQELKSIAIKICETSNALMNFMGEDIDDMSIFNVEKIQNIETFIELFNEFIFRNEDLLASIFAISYMLNSDRLIEIDKMITNKKNNDNKKGVS